MLSSIQCHAFSHFHTLQAVPIIPYSWCRWNPNGVDHIHDHPHRPVVPIFRICDSSLNTYPIPCRCTPSCFHSDYSPPYYPTFPNLSSSTRPSTNPFQRWFHPTWLQTHFPYSTTHPFPNYTPSRAPIPMMLPLIPQSIPIHFTMHPPTPFSFPSFLCTNVFWTSSKGSSSVQIVFWFVPMLYSICTWNNYASW